MHRCTFATELSVLRRRQEVIKSKIICIRSMSLLTVMERLEKDETKRHQCAYTLHTHLRPITVNWMHTHIVPMHIRPDDLHSKLFVDPCTQYSVWAFIVCTWYIFCHSVCHCGEHNGDGDESQDDESPIIAFYVMTSIHNAMPITGLNQIPTEINCERHKLIISRYRRRMPQLIA